MAVGGTVPLTVAVAVVFPVPVGAAIVILGADVHVQVPPKFTDVTAPVALTSAVAVMPVHAQDEKVTVGGVVVE